MSTISFLLAYRKNLCFRLESINMRDKRILCRTIPLLFVLLLMSCSTSPGEFEQLSYKPITGSILMDKAVVLKSGISVEIKLLDVTIPEDEEIQLSKQIIKNPNKNQFNFLLRFDQADIQPYGRYIVRIVVFEGETLIYKGVGDTQVLTRGFPDTISESLISVY